MVNARRTCSDWRILPCLFTRLVTLALANMLVLRKKRTSENLSPCDVNRVRKHISGTDLEAHLTLVPLPDKIPERCTHVTLY